jgi:hypothetical protein
LFYIASFFDLGVDFKVFLSHCLSFEGHVRKNVVILTSFKKMVLPVAPLFDLGVDFYVFYAKIWVLRGRVLVNSVTMFLY